MIASVPASPDFRAIVHLADAQLGDQRSVARQNTQLTIRAGKRDLHDGLAEQLALRGNDNELDGIGKHSLS